MGLASGTKLGPYEVISPLGAGGMGEVYRARDTRLERNVAVKILPAHLSDKPEACERFEREARTISSLNHPHICQLHDVGSQGGVRYLVMELLEGETLADRLQRGPMSLEQVLRCGAEISEGLDAAHRCGVVHRDLKPGNIMLTKSGAKLMDFGLAKGVSPTKPQSTELTVTMTSPQAHPLTAEGTIVGTFQYMSPEQVEGKEADARSDIFSLGAVLYEMTTGKPAFAGKSLVSVAAAILEKEPEPIAALQPAAPSALQHVTQVCMAKDPDSRWQSAADVGHELRWIASAPSQAGSPNVVSRSHWLLERLVWGALVALLVAACFLLYQSHPQARVLRASLLPPPDATFDLTGDFSAPPVLSPDGSQLAFAAHGAKERNAIWIRNLRGSAEKLAGTEGGYAPFWSADSRFLGFFAEGKLRKIPAAGGPVTVLADAPNARGGAWGKNNVIVYSPDYRESLWKIVASGSGTPAPATKLDASKHSTHRWPVFLPDGKHFLYLATNHAGGDPAQNGIYFASTEDDTSKLVMTSDSDVVYAAGYLLFHQQRSVMAQKFDPANGSLSGEVQPVVNDVRYDAGTWHTTFTATDDGLFVYERGTSSMADYGLVWMDRNGKSLANVGDPTSYKGIRLSPDGKRLVVAVGDPLIDVWVLDLARGAKTRVTFDPVTHVEPAWSADGQKVVYMVQNGPSIMAGSTLHAKPANGSGKDELLLAPDAAAGPTSLMWPEYSADGHYLAYQKQSGPTGASVWAIPLTGEPKPFLVVKPESDQGTITHSRLSPDGHWLAYSSRDAGREEVYVTSFPGGSGRWQVSTDGGTFPVWRGDGKELFYIGYDAQLHAVETTAGAQEFAVGRTQILFAVRYIAPLFAPFDVSPDGQKFLVASPLAGQSEPLILLSDWKADLKK